MNPPATALSTSTVNDTLPLSSDALAAAMLSVAVSALVIVPVAVPPATLVVEGASVTVKVSLPSTIASFVTGTVKVWLSPAVPAKVSVCGAAS